MRREELQIEGLRESTAYIHGLMRMAIEEVGAKNVMLGGLSQGCAAALIALLTWDEEEIRGMFGMCGWLPLGRQVDEIAKDVMDLDVEFDANDPFAGSEGEQGMYEETVDRSRTHCTPNATDLQ